MDQRCRRWACQAYNPHCLTRHRRSSTPSTSQLRRWSCPLSTWAHLSHITMFCRIPSLHPCQCRCHLGSSTAAWASDKPRQSGQPPRAAPPQVRTAPDPGPPATPSPYPHLHTNPQPSMHPHWHRHLLTPHPSAVKSGDLEASPPSYLWTWIC